MFFGSLASFQIAGLDSLKKAKARLRFVRIESGDFLNPLCAPCHKLLAVVVDSGRFAFDKIGLGAPADKH